MYDPGNVVLPETNARDMHEKRRIHTCTYWPPAFDERLLRESMAAYYGTISFIDFQIGRILRTLREEGMVDNTYVVFTSDHGMEFGHHGMFGHSFTSVYDEQVRAPLVASGPGLARGGVSTAGIESIDLAPTFLELAGLPAGERMDGRSQLAAFSGDDLVGREVLYSESCWLEEELRTGDGRPIPGGERRVMRLEHPWKYIYSTEESREELYHLDNDPGERENLVAARDHAERVRGNRESVTRWLEKGETSEPGVIDPVEDFTRYDPSPSRSEREIEGVHHVRADEREDLRARAHR